MTKAYPFLIDLNDGELVWHGLMRKGAIDDGWGVAEITVVTQTPVKIDFLRPFIAAAIDGVEAALRPALEKLEERERAGEEL